MPELPDVQVFKEYLDATSLHQRIRDVDVAAQGMLAGVSERTLRRKLKGHKLKSARRHGKHLFVRVTDDGWLWLHFGMSGELKYFKDGEETLQYTRLRFHFSNGYHLAYVTIRKLGKIGLVDDVDAFVEEKALGPDALDLDLQAFRAALHGRRGAIKSALMNQRVIAGIGNVYADETLFAAGIDPRARTENLHDETLRALHRAMRRVLRRAIDARVDPEKFPRTFLLPHRGEGGKCPLCGTALMREKVSGRTTYYCPRDQNRAR